MPDRVDAYAADMRNGLFGPSDFHFAVLDDWAPDDERSAPL
jgi:hypothetical protein